MSGPSYDVVVVGAGIVGAACADEFARGGRRVALIGADIVGSGATAAGMGHIVVMDDSEAQFALTHYSRALWHELAPDLPADNFRVEPVEANSFPDAFADVVISSAVLHFARDDAHFTAMLQGTWRVLKPGGLFFCRLASSIGMEHQITAIGGSRFVLPDHSERYLVNEEWLLRLTEQLGGQLLDPLKTTVVQNQRAMTTWVVRKDI